MATINDEEVNFRIEVPEEEKGSEIAVPAFFQKREPNAWSELIGAAHDITFEEYTKKRDYIIRNTSRESLLMHLAEECAEVICAVNKVIRSEYSIDDPTPVLPVDAELNLREELEDVLMLIDALDIDCCESATNPKWIRWADRKGYTNG